MSDITPYVVTGLSAEARQKLISVQPRTLGQASRISGVPAADVQLLWVAIEHGRRSKTAAADGEK